LIFVFYTRISLEPIDNQLLDFLQVITKAGGKLKASKVMAVCKKTSLMDFIPARKYSNWTNVPPSSRLA
jgi:hypothetical protein